MIDKIISKIEQLKRKLRYSCYKNEEKYGSAANEKCHGMSGGKKHLCKMCIDCPYFSPEIEEE